MGLRHYFLFGIIVSTIGYLSYVEYPEPCDFPVLIKSYYSIIRLVTNLSYVWYCIGGSYVSLVRLVEFDFSPEVEGVSITKIVLGGVQTTVFNPLTGLDKDKDDAASAIIYFHGGGFAVGSVGLYSSFVKTLSKNSGMVIIFLEYRLAPEHPYPIGLQDCITASLDFVNQAEKFNVDRNKIVFMGDSAGGNLAMAVSLNLAKRDKEYFKPCHMTIVYPLLQMSNFKLPSYKKNANSPLVSPEQAVRYVLLYMGIQNFTDLVQPMVHNMHIKGLNTDGFAEKITESLVPQKLVAFWIS